MPGDHWPYTEETSMNQDLYTIESKRLQLRQIEAGDASYILSLLNDPSFIEYIGDKEVRSEEEARTYIEQGPAKSYSEHGFGLYLVVRKQDQTPIGMCGLIKRDGLDDPDIGFAFSPEYCGKGYAVEAAEATMAYAQDILHIPTIVAIASPENEPSVRLLAKLGLQLARMILLPHEDEDVGYFCSP